jgi:hypothetical protein
MSRKLPILPADCWTHILSFIVCDIIVSEKKYEYHEYDVKVETSYLNKNYAVWALGLKHINEAYKDAIIIEMQKKFGHLGLPYDFVLSRCLLQSPNLKIDGDIIEGQMVLRTMRRAFELNCATPLLKQISIKNRTGNDCSEIWKQFIDQSMNCPEAFDVICCHIADNDDSDMYYEIFSKLSYQLAFDGNLKLLQSVGRFAYPSQWSDRAMVFAGKIAKGMIDGKRKKLFNKSFERHLRPIAQILAEEMPDIRQSPHMRINDQYGNQYDIDDIERAYQKMLTDILHYCCGSKHGTVDQIELLVTRGAKVKPLKLVTTKYTAIRSDICCTAIRHIDIADLKDPFDQKFFLTNALCNKSLPVIRSVLDMIPRMELKDDKKFLAHCCADPIIEANDVLLTELHERKIFTPVQWIEVFVEILCIIQDQIMPVQYMPWKVRFTKKYGTAVDLKNQQIIQRVVRNTGLEFNKGNYLWKHCADRLEAQYDDYQSRRVCGYYEVPAFLPKDRHRCTHGFMNQFRKTFFGHVKKTG